MRGCVPRAKIEFLPDATREIEEAFNWYLDRSQRAAEDFLGEINRSLELITEQPEIWPRFEAEARRYVLGKFPYSVIYRQTKDGIQVIAVAHQKRKPQYWVRRLH